MFNQSIFARSMFVSSPKLSFRGGDPLSKGLLAAWLATGGTGGGQLIDVVSGYGMFPMKLTSFVETDNLMGMHLEDNTQGLKMLYLPEKLRITDSVLTVIWCGKFRAAAVANFDIFAVWYDIGLASPYYAYGFFIDSLFVKFSAGWNKAGTWTHITDSGGVAPNDGSVHQLALRMGGGTASLNVDGVDKVAPPGGSVTTINYGTTPIVYVGSTVSQKVDTYYALIFNRTLSESECSQIYSNPSLLFNQPLSFSFLKNFSGFRRSSNFFTVFN